MKKVFATLKDLVVKVLREGTSPRRVALAIALGLAMSVFPWFGAPTILCAAIAPLLKLNMALMQAANFATGPLQYVLWVPFIKIGGFILGVEIAALDGMAELLRQDAGAAMGALSRTFLLGVTGWMMTSLAAFPLLYAVLQFAIIRTPWASQRATG